MSILLILVPVALGIVLIAGVAFVWATRRGQFDDLETPALRILRDDLDSRSKGPPPASPKLGD